MSFMENIYLPFTFKFNPDPGPFINVKGKYNSEAQILIKLYCILTGQEPGQTPGGGRS